MEAFVAKDVILLVCTAGVSTNLLVAKMQLLADVKGLNVDVFATNASEFDEAMEKFQVKVVLLSPQLRYLFGKLSQELAGTKIPLDVISMQDYGNMDSENILQHAMSLKI